MQRLGWALLGLIVVAAVAGLLGPGPLSSTTRSAPSWQVEIEYARFAHNRADMTLEFHLKSDPERPEPAQVWISAEYLAGVTVQQIVPEPQDWTAGGDGVVLTFPVRDRGASVHVQMEIRPSQMGLLHGAIGVPGRQPVKFWQLVYP